LGKQKAALAKAEIGKAESRNGTTGPLATRERLKADGTTDYGTIDH
jgi:hypothetical protein